MFAADAVAPKLPDPLEERLPVRDIKPLTRSKCHCRRRGHSAPPRCRLRITVAFSSFVCLRPTKDSWRGLTCGESTVYYLKNITNYHHNGCFLLY